ncbi:transposase, partial [Paraburkholderia aspalathi]
RVGVSTHCTDWVVTNDLTQDSSTAAQDACGLRWKIGQFHRGFKQLAGCQCRKARIQRNHIASAVRVWVRLADIARQATRTLYQVNHEMLDDFLRRELKNLSVPMRFA